MSTWPTSPLAGHIDEVTLRKGDTTAEILSVTNSAGFVRSLDAFDKQVFSADASNYKLVQHNDLAYNPSRVNVGSVARCTLPEGGAVSPMYVVVRCRPSLSPQYLLYFLKSRVGRQHITHRCVGAVRFMLRYDDLERIDLPIPPRDEQERLVQILDEIQLMRELQLQAERRQLQARPALLRSFLEAKRTGVTKKTPLGELVEKERGISYGVVQRGDDVADGVPVIRIGDFAENVLAPEDVVRVSPDISNQYSRTVLKGGELLVSIRGTVGRVAIAPAWSAGWNVAREVAVVPLLPHVSRPLAYSYLLSAEAQHFMLGEVRGAAQSGINLEDLRKLPFPLLSRDNLEEFEQDSAELDLMSSAQVTARKHLDESMESILDRAFQGEL